MPTASSSGSTFSLAWAFPGSTVAAPATTAPWSSSRLDTSMSVTAA